MRDAPLFEGLLYSRGIEHREGSAGINRDRERFIPHLGGGFSEQIKREPWEEPLWFLGDAALGVQRTLEGLVRRLKVTEALKCVTISLQ